MNGSFLIGFLWQLFEYLRLSTDPPLVIEIVDSEAYTNHLLPFLDEVIGERLITMAKVRVVRYQGNQ